jgi:hypothetical protein
VQERDESERQGHVQDEHKKTKTSILHYKEGEEKEYISKSDGFLDFYGANVAIQKVNCTRQGSQAPTKQALTRSFFRATNSMNEERSLIVFLGTMVKMLPLCSVAGLWISWRDGQN